MNPQDRDDIAVLVHESDTDSDRAIELPGELTPRKSPSAQTHAKYFTGALLLITLIGGLLLATPYTTKSGERTPIVDAVFTSISAASITGLITVDSATHWNTFGHVVILLLVQSGGLGFMVGAGVLLLILRRGAISVRDARLMQDGAPTTTLQEALMLARRIALFTLFAEAIGAVILTIEFWGSMPFGRALWFGVFHSVSAFCNAGFEILPPDRDVRSYRFSFPFMVTMMVLIQAGALSYMVLADAIKTRDWKRMALDTRIVLVGSAVMLIGAGTSFLLIEWNGLLANDSIPGKFFEALFQSAAGRTAGFATVDWADANPLTLLFWIAAMMVGGASGSATGGVKITTVAVVVAAMLSAFRARNDVEITNRRIPAAVVYRALAVIGFFLTMHFTFTAALILLEAGTNETSKETIFLTFEAMSALATVGLSPGVTGALSDGGKLLLCLAMFIGRLGPITVAYALQLRATEQVRTLPDGQIRIG